MTDQITRPIIHWLTVVAIAAICLSFSVAFHEGTHALTTLVQGGTVTEFSAHHIRSKDLSVNQRKVVAGSASIANIILGTLLWLGLRRSQNASSTLRFFLWLLMLVNWLYGSGYWMFSGVANVGDWATVIKDWEPHWLWRSLMILIGTALFMFFVFLALRELGKMIGGTEPERIQRATQLGLLSYATAVFVSILAAFFNPYGITSLPAVAGSAASLGALSPLLWMMQWFRAKIFAKPEGPPLEIPRSRPIVIIACITVFLYTYVLGSTLYF